MSHEKPKTTKNPTERTTEDKLRLLVAAARLDEEELGEFLRREGLEKADLDEWMALAAMGFEKAKKPTPEAKRIKELEKQIRRREKELAEANALLVLKQKAEAIWGAETDENDDK